MRRNNHFIIPIPYTANQEARFRIQNSQPSRPVSVAGRNFVEIYPAEPVGFGLSTSKVSQEAGHLQDDISASLIAGCRHGGAAKNNPFAVPEAFIRAIVPMDGCFSSAAYGGHDFAVSVGRIVAFRHKQQAAKSKTQRLCITFAVEIFLSAALSSTKGFVYTASEQFCVCRQLECRLDFDGTKISANIRVYSVKTLKRGGNFRQNDNPLTKIMQTININN